MLRVRRDYANFHLGLNSSQTLLIVFLTGFVVFMLLIPPPDLKLQSVRVKESTVFTRKYCTELTSLSMLSVFEVEIWCYRGGNVVPKWIDRQAGR